LENGAARKAIEAHGVVLLLPSNPTFEGYRLNGEELRVRKLHQMMVMKVGKHRVLDWDVKGFENLLKQLLLVCSTINFEP